MVPAGVFEKLLLRLGAQIELSSLARVQNRASSVRPDSPVRSRAELSFLVAFSKSLEKKNSGDRAKQHARFVYSARFVQRDI